MTSQTKPTRVDVVQKPLFTGTPEKRWTLFTVKLQNGHVRTVAVKKR